MLKATNVSSLTAIFGNIAGKEQDREKLMDLYWNRAELKKEFAGMRKEQLRLQDRIKQQEGRSARIQQKLEHLEGLLVDPKWAHNVVVHYQLRGLSDRCHRKLAKFAEQLKQQREKKQHKSILHEWHASLASEIEQVQQQLLDKRESNHQLEDRLQAERRRLTSMSAFARFFRGKSVTATLDQLAEQVELAQIDEQLLGEKIVEIRNRKPPDAQGLDIPTKRSINLMIIAFTQQMYVHFAKCELADLIKEAGEKSVGAINYGTESECQHLLKRMHSCVDTIERGQDSAGILQQRAKLLGGRVKYPSAEDAVPASASAATLFKIDDSGVVRESELDLLGANYWGVNKVLSR
jgi:chromosome segregation ATPase